MLIRRLRTTTAAAVLLLAGCTAGGHPMGQRTPEALVDSTWLAEDIGDAGVLDRAQTTVAFNADGRVAGSGGCNRYSGMAVSDGGRTLTFANIGVTRKSCGPAVDEQERRFFAALTAARSYRLEEMDRTLVLLGDEGAALARFRALTP